jgi:hypothetical protein
MARLQSDHIIQCKTSWIQNKDIKINNIQMKLCFNNYSKKFWKVFNIYTNKTLFTET